MACSSVADHLQIGVVARQQPAQEMEIAFVELLFGTDVSHPVRCVTGVRPSPLAICLHDVRKRSVVPVLRAPLHARRLQRIFCEHHQLRRPVAGKDGFKRRDLAAENLGRRSDQARIDRQGRAQLQDRSVFEYLVAQPSGEGAEIAETQLQIRHPAFVLAHFHAEQLRGDLVVQLTIHLYRGDGAVYGGSRDWGLQA